MPNKVFRWIVAIAAVFPLLGGSLAAQSHSQKAHTPPNYCKPCLFYGGDFDGFNSDSNGVLDFMSLSSDGEAYVPFTVPRKEQWQVTGLSVTLVFATNVVPSRVKWEIRKGVTTGDGGTLVASGIGRPSIAEFWDCTAPLDVTCLELGTNGLKVSLPSGRYWMAVMPLCEGKGSNCSSQDVYYILDVEDQPPPNHYGPLEPWDDSFWSSKSQGAYFEPTWGATGACQGIGCDRFSASVLGTKAKVHIQ
jgi:hypothetical protein